MKPIYRSIAGERWHLPLPWADAHPAHRYELAVPDDERRMLAMAWLWLGVAALALSGVFAILLVIGRTPFVQQIIPIADFFRIALVVHVDLSVLVWFVASAGLAWTIAWPGRLAGLNAIGLALTATGAACLVAAPFVDRGAPVMANYVPVIDAPVFLYGLVLIGVALLVLVVRGLLVAPRPLALADGASSLRFGLWAAAVSAGIALAALAWTWYELPPPIDARTYYETLFWGAGHVIQFTWTLLMLVAWLWLASLIGARLPLTPRLAGALLALSLAAALIAPLIYIQWPVIAIEHQRMFTWLMRFGGGLSILPLGLAIGAGLALAPTASPTQRPLREALLASMLLFAIGGAIGFMIQGNDVRIPAHYHGSIVGVTLALMGLAYALAPRLGGRHVPGRLACWQIRCYAGGQLLHIIGLVWSGGYGVQRKVAGAEQVLDSTSQVLGMGLMGLGGMIAIIGGLLFVVVIWRAMHGARFLHA